MSEPVFFRFEQDFVDSLRCVPMCVRLKLDLVGVKLSLRQWSRFTFEDRDALARGACSSAAEVKAYRGRLVDLIAARAREAAKLIPVEAAPAWADLGGVPGGVAAQALHMGCAPPTLAQWRRLGDLQRFALVKLSRDGHDNVNFAPALREFGLGAAATAAA